MKAAETPAGATTLEEAVRHHREGRLNEAEHAYLSLISESDGDYRARYNLGILLLRHGRAAEAVGHLGAAAQADGTRVENWLGYIEALVADRRWVEALLIIQKLRGQGLAGARLDALEDAAQPTEAEIATAEG